MQISDNKPQPIPEPPLDFAFIASPLNSKPANMEERRYPTSKIKEVFDVPLSCLSFIFFEIKDLRTSFLFFVLLHHACGWNTGFTGNAISETGNAQ